MKPAQASKLVILRLRVLCGRGQRVFRDQENDSEEEDVGEEAEEKEVEPLNGLHAEVRLSLVSTLHSTIVLNYSIRGYSLLCAHCQLTAKVMKWRGIEANFR
jgi:hypothetical protein